MADNKRYTEEDFKKEISEMSKVMRKFNSQDFMTGKLRLVDSAIMFALYGMLNGFIIWLLDALLSFLPPQELWVMIFRLVIFLATQIVFGAYLLIGAWRCAFNVNRVFVGYIVRVSCVIGGLVLIYSSLWSLGVFNPYL